MPGLHDPASEPGPWIDWTSASTSVGFDDCNSQGTTTVLHTDPATGLTWDPFTHSGCSSNRFRLVHVATNTEVAQYRFT